MQKDILKNETKKKYGKISLEKNNLNSCCKPYKFKNIF